jgi:hypothetical protein
LDVQVVVKKEERKLETGDIIVVIYAGKTYVLLVSMIQRGECPYMLVHLDGSGIWASEKTLELLEKNIRNNDMDFYEYEYTIYSASEYVLQLTKK